MNSPAPDLVNADPSEVSLQEGTPEKPTALPLEFSLRGVRFAFVRLLGKGGMADVGLYRQTNAEGESSRPMTNHPLPEFLALKRYFALSWHSVFDDIVQDRRRRGLIEMSLGRTMRDCRHYTLKKLQYLLMPVIYGRSLNDVIFSGAIDPDAVVHIGYKMMRALTRLHAHDVVHLDLKPENIFVTPEGELELIDYDFANITRGRVIQKDVNDGIARGTDGFAAPEQWNDSRGAPAVRTSRTDAYAAAQTLFRVANRGQGLATGSSKINLLVAHSWGLRKRKGSDKLYGPFLGSLREMENKELSAILIQMLMADHDQRICSGEAAFLLYEECKRRGIRDPNRPLFPAVPFVPGEKMSAVLLVIALNDEAYHRRSRASTEMAN